MRVLNLYAGIGGNRKFWNDADVTAVESNEKIASVYSSLYPQDQVVIGDAHEYLASNFNRFDFIWSSPPCQSHTRMQKFTRHKSRKYPDMTLWQEIIFLTHFFKKPWVVENVVPYYAPLVPQSCRVGRHCFWSNFKIAADDVSRPSNFINRCNLAGKKAMMEWLGIHFDANIYYEGNHCPAQVLRNCVHPEIGRQVFDSAFPPTN